MTSQATSAVSFIRYSNSYTKKGIIKNFQTYLRIVLAFLMSNINVKLETENCNGLDQLVENEFRN